MLTINYSPAQCEAAEPKEWLCSADHAAEICWQEETFGAASNFSFQDRLISDLSGAARWTTEQVLSSWNTDISCSNGPPSSTLFPRPHPPPVLPPDSHLFIPPPSPHHLNCFPDWPVAHVFIHAEFYGAVWKPKLRLLHSQQLPHPCSRRQWPCLNSWAGSSWATFSAGQVGCSKL